MASVIGIGIGDRPSVIGMGTGIGIEGGHRARTSRQGHTGRGPPRRASVHSHRRLGAGPGRARRGPRLDAGDIADVVAAALTDERHTGRTYELSGPRLLSFHDVVRDLSAATGRTITYVPVGADDYRAALRAAGEPEEFADLFTLITDGRNASVVHGVREVLGREPKDFSAYADETAATGVWDV